MFCSLTNYHYLCIQIHNTTHDNMKKNKTVTTPTREEIFREKAKTYVPCFSVSCPLREHCLRALVRPYTPQDRFVTLSVNLAQPDAETEQCFMYRNDQPVRMAVGIEPVYHDIPGWMERSIKSSLIQRYGRKRYYEYHNGTRPLPPSEEQHIRALLRSSGWTQEPQFESYVEEYMW